jgi:hypothetical protein
MTARFDFHSAGMFHVVDVASAATAAGKGVDQQAASSKQGVSAGGTDRADCEVQT